MAQADTIQQHPSHSVVHSPKTAALEPAGPSQNPSMLGRAYLLLVTVLLGWLAWKVAHGKYYTPRSGFGFYLGVAGTLMMLALLTYPLRKHLRWTHRWGALKHWFRLHMWLGILGPTLVLFHSTFHVRSPNAAVALFSMLIVVISGIIGRFVYTKIHYGLYGSRATLEKVQKELLGRSDDAKSRLHCAHRVEQWLLSFEQSAIHTERSFPANLLHFFTLELRRRIIEFRCAQELRHVLRAEKHPEFRMGAPEAIGLASLYLREVQHVAQFSTYERLFSLWHVLHIPLIYILAASTVFHVIAVYMY